MALTGDPDTLSASFVAWPYVPDANRDSILAVLRDALDGTEGSGVSHVLPGLGAQTVSVFHHPGATRPWHVWFVEHPTSDAWTDPPATIRQASPLFETGLADHLESDPAVTVTDVSPDATELVHAFLPDRPAGYADQTDDTPIVRSRDDSTTPIPDVVPLRLRVRSGLATRAVRGLAWLTARTPAWLEARFDSATQPILEAEGMQTETLLLHRQPDGDDIWWYMEADDMGQVETAYYESWNPIARLSEHALGLILEAPDRVLAHPVEASEFELLLHAVAPTRGGLP